MKKCLFLFSLVACCLTSFAENRETENCENSAREQANRASSSAIIRLLNSRAAGSPKAFAAAVSIVARDAEEGKPLQQYVIALMADEKSPYPELRVSQKTRENYFAASRPRLQELAKKKSNALAFYLLSMETNDRTLLKRAAEGGNIQALNAFGTLLLLETLSNIDLDENTRKKEMAHCFDCFHRAAKEKDVNGFYNLGMCYMHGYGCDKDVRKAFDYFRTAAELGHVEAINNLGGFCRDGIVVEKDVVLATKWFAKSAALGNAYGKFNYALALQRGEGTATDSKRAVALYKESANEGCVEALNAMGMCLMNGDGIAKNEVDAVRYFHDAAKNGCAPAMENLAECYDRGLGGLKKSAQDAVLWKVRARAARGDVNAAAWLSENGYSAR